MQAHLHEGGLKHCVPQRHAPAQHPLAHALPGAGHAARAYAGAAACVQRGYSRRSRGLAGRPTRGGQQLRLVCMTHSTDRHTTTTSQDA